MSVVLVQPGGSIELKPSDSRTVAFDWDRRSLRSGVIISTSSFAIAVVRQIGATALTSDNPGLLNATDASIACERTVGASRVTQVRLIATTATEGDEYLIENTVVTNESPTQTKKQSFRVLIRN